MADQEAGASSEKPWWRVAPVIACIAAAAVLVLLLIPGVLMYPNDQETASPLQAPAIQAAEEANDILRERIEYMKRALDANVCVADGKLTTPNGPLPDEILNALPGPPPTLADPAKSAVMHLNNYNGTVADLLNDSAVVVNVETQDGNSSSGSGAFIGPDLIVTNAHVIENAILDRIFIYNDRVGVLKAQLLAEGAPASANSGKPDLALLKVDAPAGGQFLALATGQQGQTVIAATFPGAYTSSNAGFKKWLDDPQSAPGAIPPLLDVQILNARFDKADGFEYIFHTAIIGRGSSGGPLADECGRLVGVNVGAESLKVDKSIPFFQAISDKTVEQFVNQHGLGPIVRDSAVCGAA